MPTFRDYSLVYIKISSLGGKLSASYQDITGLFEKLLLHLFHIHYRYILQTHEQHLVIGTGLPTQGPSNGEFLSLLLLLILLLFMLLLTFCNCFCFCCCFVVIDIVLVSAAVKLTKSVSMSALEII